MRGVRWVLAVFLIAISVPAGAQPAGEGFSVVGDDCDEVGATVQVPASRLDAVMDTARWRPTGADVGSAHLVVAVAACGSLTVDGRAGAPAVFSDVGVLIDAPDGGDDGLHVYQLWQVGDHPLLMASMAGIGLPTAWVRGGTVEVEGMSASGSMPWGRSPYAVEVTSPVPRAIQGDSGITWWHEGDRGVIRVRYNLAEVTMLPGAGVVTTSPGTPLHDLAGAATTMTMGLIFAFDVTGDVQLVE